MPGWRLGGRCGGSWCKRALAGRVLALDEDGAALSSPPGVPDGRPTWDHLLARLARADQSRSQGCSVPLAVQPERAIEAEKRRPVSPRSTLSASSAVALMAACSIALRAPRVTRMAHQQGRTKRASEPELASSSPRPRPRASLSGSGEQLSGPSPAVDPRPAPSNSPVPAMDANPPRRGPRPGLPASPPFVRRPPSLLPPLLPPVPRPSAVRLPTAHCAARPVSCCAADLVQHPPTHELVPVLLPLSSSLAHPAPTFLSTPPPPPPPHRRDHLGSLA